MPKVVIPACFLDSANVTPDEAVYSAEAQTVAELRQELFQRFPPLFTRFKNADGTPSTKWFGLYCERVGDFVVDTDDVILTEDDRIELVNFIGC